MGKETEITWNSQIIEAYSKVLFFRMKKVNNVFNFEVVMVGSEEECEKTTARITVLDTSINSKSVAEFSYNPRPLGLEKWGDFCFSVPEKVLSKVWQYHGERKDYGFKIAVKIDVC